MATDRIQIAEESTCQQILQILQNGGGDTEKIVQIKALLENTTYGLSAIKNMLGNNTYGLSAIKTKLNGVDTTVGKKLKLKNTNFIYHSGDTMTVTGKGVAIILTTYLKGHFSIHEINVDNYSASITPYVMKPLAWGTVESDYVYKYVSIPIPFTEQIIVKSVEDCRVGMAYWLYE